MKPMKHSVKQYKGKSGSKVSEGPFESFEMVKRPMKTSAKSQARHGVKQFRRG